MVCDVHPRQMVLARAGFHWQPGEAVWQKGELVLTDCMVDAMSAETWQHFLHAVTEGDLMNRDEIRAAIQQLKAQGEPVTGPRVYELLGKKGSYREIYSELKMDHGALIEDTVVETTIPSSSIANGPIIPDAPLDPVAEACGELSRAEGALAAAEAKIPALEAALGEARQAAVEAAARHEQVGAAIRLRVLSSRDASLGQAAAELQSARQRLKTAEHALAQATAALATRRGMVLMWQGAVQQAKREHYLQEHKPELLERLAEIEAARASDRRLGGPSLSEKLRAEAEHGQARAKIDARISSVLAEAGL
jgi:hypothetical protein